MSSILADRDPRFRRLGLKIALFIVLVGAGIAGLIAALGFSSGLFAETVPYHFVAPNALEIKRGMAVMLSGFKVGKVSRLELMANSESGVPQVAVDLEIEKDYTHWFREGTAVSVRKLGFIGDGYLEVMPGPAKNPLLKPRGIVSFLTGTNIDEAIKDVKEQVTPILDEVHDLLTYVNDPDGDIKQAVSEYRKTGAELNRTLKDVQGSLKRVDQLLTSADRVVNQDVRAAIGDTRATIQEAQTTLAETRNRIVAIEENVQPLLKKADDSLNNVQQMTSTLKETVNQAAPQIPAVLKKGQTVMDQGQRTLKNSNELVDDLKVTIDGARQHWPLNLWAPTPEDPLLPQDSHD